VVAAPTVWEPFWREGAGMFRHGYTYSGHAAVSAAALANLEIIEREGLVGRAAALEGTLLTGLQTLRAHPLVREVRGGVGVLAAVQLTDRVATDPAVLARVVPTLRGRGIMGRVLAGGALQISPPLVMTNDEVQELTDGLRAALEDLEGVT
jgi:adenosylmethionine-8-amino-7-oxononanoate aminotransferase